MYQFRDPVHGFIEVTEDEKRIIDSKPFQRLRYIKQLATTNLVYHGAEHTRFGHSLGVMHLVSKTFDAVTEKNPKLFSGKQKDNEKKCKYYRQILRLIALTHDLGHAPFSHASEELFPAKKRHEDYTKDIIFNTEIADYINEIGRKFQQEHGEEYCITPQIIWMIYNGDVFEDGYVTPDFQFLQGFMDGELDCDKMDYLLRDSMFCGVSYGTYDLERFISTLTVYKSEKTMKLAIEKGGIQALEEFILARYFMFIQVYFHKTRRYFDKQLVKALKVILPEEHYPESTETFLEWDDNRVMYELKKSTHPDVKAFVERKTMTCVYETPAHAGSAEVDKFDMIRNRLQEKCQKKSILIDKVDKAAHKLLPLYFATKDKDDDSGKAIIILDRKASKPRNLMEESRILNSIIEPINICRIYVDKSEAEKAKKEMGKLMGGVVNG